MFVVEKGSLEVIIDDEVSDGLNCTASHPAIASQSSTRNRSQGPRGLSW